MFLTLQQIRAIEHTAADKYQLDLMELAASAISTWVSDHFTQQQPILVLIGPGNNGGDGLVAASKLHRLGYNICVNVVVPHLSGPTAKLLDQFIQQGGKQLLDWEPQPYDLIIDAIFGIGINTMLDSTLIMLFKTINQSTADNNVTNNKKPIVLAIDTPSGFDPFTGQIYGATITATHTLTFISDKPGFYTGDGLDITLAVTLVPLIDIADYADVINTIPVAQKVNFNILQAVDYQHLARNRRKNTHKGDFGTVAIIGGNVGMHGALYLAAKAAMLLGSGKVTMAAIDPAFNYDYSMPELMLSSVEHVLDYMNTYSVIVVGPGFGTDKLALNYLRKLVTLASDNGAYPHQSLVPKYGFIFDADALNLIAAHAKLQRDFTAITPKIITPHPAEAARLLAIDVASVQNNRLKAVTNLATSFNAIALLKGAGSLIHDNNNNIYVNQTGNPALANAGQGDTLCGITSSLVAQGLELAIALKLAVYIQGMAADELSGTVGCIGVLASEIALASRAVLNHLLYK